MELPWVFGDGQGCTRALPVSLAILIIRRPRLRKALIPAIRSLDFLMLHRKRFRLHGWPQPLGFMEAMADQHEQQQSFGGALCDVKKATVSGMLAMEPSQHVGSLPPSRRMRWTTMTGAEIACARESSISAQICATHSL